jgi:UDP-N-acetylglucosamine:LPS N-acetylglucosamine transferase
MMGVSVGKAVECVKVCVTCSAGGHLQELLEVLPDNLYNIYLVTFKSAINSNSLVRFREIYLVQDASKRGWRLFLCLLKSIIIFAIERPKIIISSGAGVSIPTLVLAWLFRRGILYLELSCQISAPSKTGKFAYKIATRFYIQHSSLLKFYPDAILIERYENN